MASRFKDLDVSVEDFISEQENESTHEKENFAKCSRAATIPSIEKVLHNDFFA